MSAPIRVNPEDLLDKQFRWEYETDMIYIDTFEDPPGSVPPIQQVSRRIVSDWEDYDPEKT